MMPIEQTTIPTNGLHLHVTRAGSPDGPLVILLHGFPDFWYSWRRQIPALAEAGYWVWAPDQRGYNLSDKPARVSDYRLEVLAADILGLIDAAGREQAFIVGHDWGAVVAWQLGIYHPARVRHLHILNVPHPGVMDRAVRTQPRQLRKSWYVFLFQLPWLPEWAAPRHDWAALGRAVQESSRPGSFSAEDMAAYRAAWRQPGAFSSMLAWYRAMVRTSLFHPTPRQRVTPPTHIIWGRQDIALDFSLTAPSLALCEQGRLTVFNEASHWVHLDEASAVTQLILADLAATSGVQ